METSDKNASRREAFALGIAVFGAIAALISGFVAWGQLKVMREQLADARTAADASDKTTTSALHLTARSVEATEKAADAAQAGAAHSRQLVAVTQKALGAVREANRLEQRAWIAVSRIQTVPDPIEAGRPLVAQVILKNTGLTPARDVSCTAVIDPVPRGERPRFAYTDTPASVGTVFPSAEYTLSLFATISRSTGKPAPLTPELLATISNGDVQLFLHGRVTYRDIFGSKHWFTYCFSYLPGSPPPPFGACREYNETDK